MSKGHIVTHQVIVKPQPQKPKPKRKQLTLAERVKVIQRKKNGDSIKTLQEAFDVGRMQITGYGYFPCFP